MRNKIIVLFIVIAFSATIGISVKAIENPKDNPKTIETEEDAIEFIEQELAKDIPDYELHKDGIIQTIEVNEKLTLEIKEFEPGTGYNYQNVAVSNDGKVASLQRNDETNLFEWIIVNGDNVEVIDMSFYWFTSVLDTRWIDDETVQAICHYNPSTNGIFLYNLKTGLKRIYGTSFTRDSKGNLFYVESKPHFVDYSAPDCICNEAGERLYESEEDIWIQCLVADDNYLSFYERDPKNEDYFKLLVLSRETKEIVYEYNHPAYGEICIK